MKKSSMMHRVGLILMALAFVAGCTQTQQAEQVGNVPKAASDIQKKPQILKTNLLAEPPSLDPALGEDVTSLTIVRATFDGLMRADQDGKLTNAVAKHVDMSPDLLTYTFVLRDTSWSNGDPVTAHDFEYAWKRVLDPKIASPLAYKLYVIKNGEKANRGEVGLEQVGVTAKDEKTLVVTLERPTPYFLELTSYYTLSPVNKKVVSANPDWANEAATHVGNGPFLLKSWEHKSKLTLVKNENYWDKETVKLDQIDLSIIPDENTAYSMYENEDFNWLGSPLSFLPIDAVPTLKQSGVLTVQPIAATYWYEFNTERPPFQNAKIRKAFAYAINRQSLVDHITQTDEVPALGLVPSTMALSEGGYFRDNDVETAKQLLAEGMKELGITSLPPITLSYNTSEVHKKIAEVVQDQWKQTLGVEVKLENKEYKVFLDDMAQGNYQIGRLGWSASMNDPIDFLQIFKDKNGGNLSRWVHPTYKELLDQSDKETDPVKRKALLAEAEAILMDEMPISPIYYYTMSWVQQDEVKGTMVNHLGKVDFKWISIEDSGTP